MKFGFGIDIGGTTVKIAYFDETGNLLDKWEIPTVKENGGQQILPDIAVSVRDYLSKNNIPNECIIGIGLGIPGPISSEGVVNRCVNLGWGIFNIEASLHELTGFPVKAGNDANVAALGECWKGGGMGCKSMVLATLGTGVGGGIIVDGKVLYGIHGAGGEIGHMVLNRDETEQCGCGKCGCAEQYCSATGISRIAGRMLGACDTPSSLRALKNATAKDIFAAAAADDQMALAITEQYYAYLGEFTANICCIIDPEVVVLGGGVSKAGKPLLDGAKKYFNKYAFHASKDTRFELAALGNDAGAYGAFKLVLDAYG